MRKRQFRYPFLITPDEGDHDQISVTERVWLSYGVVKAQWSAMITSTKSDQDGTAPRGEKPGMGGVTRSSSWYVTNARGCVDDADLHGLPTRDLEQPRGDHNSTFNNVANMRV